MQDHTPLSVEGVDERTLLRDAHRLIVDNTHTAAELLERMGNSFFSSPRTPQHSTPRRVTISEDVTVFHDVSVELLDLPPALALLYYAAVADTPVKKVPNLLHVLELFGEPAPPPAHGNVLYLEGMRHREASAKWREERQKVLMEKEMEECTFKPAISGSAKEVAPKGLATFMEKCLAWKREAATRLARKAAQDRVYRGEDEWTRPWKMGDRSRQLFEKFKKKGKQRASLWEPKHSQRAASVVSSSSTVAQSALDGVTGRDEPDVLDAFFFHPLTRASVNKKLSCLGHAEEDDRMDTTQASEESDPSTRRIVESYLQRFERDAERRKEKLEKLRAHHAWVLKEQLHDPKTGRPLFVPNAPPTLLKNGVHVSVAELSKEERRELMKQLRLEHQEHLLVRCLRSLRDARDGSSRRQRGIDEMVDDLTCQIKRRVKPSEEETFCPKITALAREISSAKSWQPIYDRPLPKSGVQTSSSSSSFTPKSQSSSACMRRVLARSKDWIERRNRRMSDHRRTAEQKLTAECSFRPRLGGRVDAASTYGASVHSGLVDRDALVANAEARMYNELGFLRSQAALRDAEFVRAAGRSLSRLTLATAPRPSRRSVEQYARSASLVGPSQHSFTNLYGCQRMGCGVTTATTTTTDDDVRSDRTSVDHSSYDDYEDSGDVTSGDMGSFADSWGSLDAQTDLILKNCQYY